MSKISRRSFLKGMASGAIGAAAASYGIFDRLALGDAMPTEALNQAIAGAWNGSYVPGAYRATKMGRMGDVTVEVNFSEKAITSVEVVSHSETESIASVALKNIPESIVEGQTLNVDAVSGSTYTSDAILDAVADCVKQAGGDPEALKNVAGAEASKEMNPGIYTATRHGHHSDVTVQVDLGKDEILNVTVVECGETYNLSDAAVNTVPVKIVEKQSIGVDTIAGATYTSRAITGAVEDCIRQAGGSAAVRAFSVRAESEPWSTQEHTVKADVVVVGSGMAGIAAAISAQENGAKVVIVEKLPFWGGISQTCKGYFRLPFDESEESAESYYQYGLHMFCGPMKGETMDEQYPDKALLHTLSYSAYDAGKWLESKGAQLEWLPKAYIQNQPEYYLGGAHFIKDDMSAPDVAGVNFAGLLKDFVDNGGEIYLEMPVEKLLTEGGRVSGVKAVGPKGIYTFMANAVVLCAGGFGANEDMIAQFAPAYTGEENVTLIGNTGDGIRMAIEAGAQPYDCGLMMGQFGHSMVSDYDMVHPYEDNETPSSAVFVNPQGLRVNSETPVAYSGGTAYVNPDNQDYYWAVCTEEIAKQSDYIDMLTQQLAAGNQRFVTADTLADLAKKMNISPNTLRYTLNRYNKLCEAGEDTDFAKKPEFLQPLADGQGAWYAVKCFVKYFGTVGGVKINSDAAVVDKDGNPISGLFAAGENANGGFFNLSYVGGRSMPVCLTMGRIAGASAAKA